LAEAPEGLREKLTAPFSLHTRILTLENRQLEQPVEWEDDSGRCTTTAHSSDFYAENHVTLLREARHAT
jgi:hypothetical protein